ncbi:hypothetical protein BS47DRAFT_1294915 [Hydnum rufescens UP504]|uniref:Galactose mutarotase-like protein n=1 Tax=Hydnum rufescens UP504 TaxID=1448309 RepID=A0A9P6AZ10_9AGAM|nr:hypothetical protein BS47DRAFT_1294915 [Hydnum rufescens UP504]
MANPLKPIVLYPEDGSFSPPLALELLPYGLTLNKILINGDGKTHDIVIGPYVLEDHKKSRRFQNTIIGRYSNRLPVGNHDIEKGGSKEVVAPIANENTNVSLHGGPVGFDQAAFTPVDSINSSKLFTQKELTALIAHAPSATLFTHTSPAGDQGYPGELFIEVIVALSNSSRTWDPVTRERSLGSVILLYRAIVRSPNGTRVITPVNLTHHWGFNLDASYALPNGRTPDIKNHRLFIDAKHVLAGDRTLLPTGELVDTKSTTFDFSDPNPRTIGERYPDDGGYDHYWLFTSDTPRQPAHVPLKGLVDGHQDLITSIFSSTPRVQLISGKSDLKLLFSTNQRGVQFYSGGGLDESGTRKRIHGGSEIGPGYPSSSAAFLEFHAPHAAFLHAFPGATDENADTILSSDELYNHWVRLEILHTPVDE